MTVRTHVEQFMDSAQALSVSLKHDPLSRARLRDYARYLFGSYDTDLMDAQPYAYLANFLEWYGERYIFPKIIDMVVETELPRRLVFDKIVELGPGTGWLIKALAPQFSHAKCYAVDKRIFLYREGEGVKFIDRNLENADEIADLRKDLALTRSSLIIANQFLHCVENPIRVIDEFAEQTWLVVEVDSDPILPHWASQMKLFGATPMSDKDLVRAFDQSGKYGLRRTWRSPMPGLVLSLFEPK